MSEAKQGSRIQSVPPVPSHTLSLSEIPMYCGRFLSVDAHRKPMFGSSSSSLILCLRWDSIKYMGDNDPRFQGFKVFFDNDE